MSKKFWLNEKIRRNSASLVNWLVVTPIVLGLLFSETKKYQYLNAHIKLNDILLGWDTYNLNEDSLMFRAYSLDLEYNNVIQILNKKDILHD